MRIGIDCRFFGTGFTGIGRYTYELVQHLASLDRETEYVCFLNTPEFQVFTPPGKNFRAVEVSARHYSVAEQTTFLAALLRADLDLMHFTHFNAPLLYTGKSVVTIHDLTLSFFPGQKMTQPLHRLAYEAVLRRSVAHAEEIITVSEHTKDDLVRLLSTPSKKITTIYNGIGHEFGPAKNPAQTKKTVAKKYGLTQPYLLYTGVWRDHKNLLGLIQALSILRTQYTFRGQLVLTGRPDPVYAPAIFAAIKQHKLEKAVITTGMVTEKDLLSLYQAAKVFVFPSFYEGFGLPILEAMAVNVPVAASRASCLPEIAGVHNATFFDPADPADMAHTIRSTWSDQQLRKKLIAGGHARVKKFSWASMARETLAVYRKAA